MHHAAKSTFESILICKFSKMLTKRRGITIIKVTTSSRWKEYQAKGIDTPYEEVLADVKQRDYQDTHRAAAPLKQAEDAVLLDTSELDFEQSLDAMKQIIAQKIGG